MNIQQYAQQGRFCSRVSRLWDAIYRSERNPQAAHEARAIARSFRRAAGRWEQRIQQQAAGSSEDIQSLTLSDLSGLGVFDA